MALTLEKVKAIAPDQSSIDAAREFLKSSGWANLACDNADLLWECKGSGATLYRRAGLY